MYVWSGLWGVTFLSAILLFDLGLVPNPKVRAGLVAIASACCVGFVVASARVIRGSDELGRRIAVESLAIGFGGAVVLVSSFALFIKAGGSPSGILDLWLAMGFVYLIAQIVLSRRYRSPR